MISTANGSASSIACATLCTIATRDNKDDEGFYYRFVWGREPVPDEGAGAAKAVVPYGPGGGGRYARGYQGSSVRYSKMAVITPSSEDGEYDPAASCDMHTICVTQTSCKKHPGGVGCTAECKGGDAGGGGGWGGNFKLRIPYTLDHPK